MSNFFDQFDDDSTASNIPESLRQAESGGNYLARNDAIGHGGHSGHYGGLQLGVSRMEDAKRAGVMPGDMSPEQYLADPETQQQVEQWHVNDIDGYIAENGLDRFIGQEIDGVPVTRDGLIAVANLGGNYGMRQFLESGGKYNPSDINGTSLKNYLEQHQGDSRGSLTEPDAANFFDQFDVPVGSESGEGALDALKFGVQGTANRLGGTVDAMQGDKRELLTGAIEAQSIGKTGAQRRFHERLSMLTQQNGDDSLWQTVKNVAEAAWEEPEGVFHETLAQLPNSGVVLAGMAAGAKAGSMAGAGIGSVLPGAGTAAGALIGGVTGGLVGMFVGNTAVEMGGIAYDKLNDGIITDKELSDAQRQAATKGAVITGVDALTLGVNKYLMGAPGRAVEGAVRGHLIREGVDVSSDSMVRQALNNPALRESVTRAGKEAFEKSSGLKTRIGMGAGAFGLETVGEGVGEYAGSSAAGLEASMTDAVLESLLSIPQSLTELRVAKGLGTEGHLTGLLRTAPVITPEQRQQQAREESAAQGGDALDQELAAASAALMDNQPQTMADFDVALPTSGNGVNVQNLDISALPPEGTIDYNPYQQDMQPIQPQGLLSGQPDNAIDYGPVEVPNSNGLSLVPQDVASAENAIPFDQGQVSRLDDLASGIEQQVQANQQAQELQSYEDMDYQGEPDLPEPSGALRTPAEMESRLNEISKEMEGLTKAQISKPINPGRDELLIAIAKAGGINIDEARAQGIDPQHNKDRIGKRNPFRKQGMTFDEMAETLSQFGYTGEQYSANELLERVSLSLAGDAQYAPAAMDHVGQLEALEFESDQLQRDLQEIEADLGVELTEDEQILLTRMHWEAINQTEGPLNEGQATNNGQGAAGALQPQADSAPRSEGGNNQEAGQQAYPAETEGLSPDESPLLSSYSEEDLQAKVEREQADTTETDNRAQVDREAEEFSLTSTEGATIAGSNDALQQEQGGDLFSVSPQPVSKSAETETTAPTNEIVETDKTAADLGSSPGIVAMKDMANNPKSYSKKRLQELYDENKDRIVDYLVAAASDPQFEAGAYAFKRNPKANSVSLINAVGMLNAIPAKEIDSLNEAVLAGIEKAEAVAESKPDQESEASDNGALEESGANQKGSDQETKPVAPRSDAGDAEVISERIRKNAESMTSRYGDVPLSGAATDYVEKITETRRKLTESEEQEIADRHGIPASVIGQFEGNAGFGFGMIQDLAQKGDKNARAWLDESTAVKSKPSKETKQPSQSSSFGENNKLVSKSRAEELKARLKSKLGTLNSGIDPEMMAVGVELSVFYIEGGVRKFGELARLLASELDTDVAALKPYLRGWYNGARDMMEDNGQIVSDMDGPDQVRKTLSTLENDNAERAASDTTGSVEKESGQPSATSNPVDGGRRQGGSGATVSGQENDRSGSNSEPVGDRGSPAVGKSGNQRIDRPKARLEDAAARDTDDRGSLPDSTGGLFTDRNAGQSPREIAAKAPSKNPQLDSPALKTVTPSDVSEIREQMPFLTAGQVEDVAFAETRFSKPDGYGVLFTNGTGTGKTFTGLGIVRRMVAAGKKNILIVAPKQTIADSWIKAGKKFFGIDVSRLKNTKDAGDGVVVTTYANLSDNRAIMNREWDAVVADEAHYLSSDKDGSTTKALNQLRAMTLKSGTERARVNAQNPEKADELLQLRKDIDYLRKSDDQRDWAEAKMLSRKFDAIDGELGDLAEKEKARMGAIKPQDMPRAVFLSATPFSYDKNIVWAQQYLFDWGSDQDSNTSYNAGGNFEQFMMTHFGYRMRYNKLTTPDAKVDSSLMERQFNAWLRKEGVLSSRSLDSDYDYDRLFVYTDSAIGKQVDEAIEWLREQRHENENYAGFEELYSKMIDGQFDYHSRLYFLEAIKAREAIPHIKAHLAKGRKVLVMHDRKKGGAVNPFRLHPAELNDDSRAAYREFTDKFSGLVDAFSFLPSPIDSLSEAFPEAMIYNGDVPAKKRIAMQDEFNSDDKGSPRLMVAQGEAMREGVSVHDTTGEHPRVLVHLGMPVKPTAAIQQEGRIYRTGQASDAMFRYFTIGTSWERYAFASTIASRAGTAENLAMGTAARGLKQSFINAYENADQYEPGFDGEGKGGKEIDQSYTSMLTPWDEAKSLYFGTKKQGKGRGSRGREHSEFFATPEPLGMKMVQWADIRAGEKALEPSAGHGAIARWFPENSENRAIEYTSDLSSRLALHFDGDLITGDFLDHNKVNKYDAIVMNPPFGRGGSDAAKHIEKGLTHLRDGGRLVALIPEGPAADKRFDQLLYDNEEGMKDIYLAAEIKLPRVVFERAGTEIPTRVIVLEKQSNEDLAAKIQQQNRDYSGADTIDEFFDRLETSEIRERVKPVDEEAQTESDAAVTDKANAVGGFSTWETEHTKTGEKVFMAKANAKLERDEYNHVAAIAKKNGGYWSRFGKAGFLFKSEEDRQRFVAAVSEGGEEVPAMMRRPATDEEPTGLPVKQVEFVVNQFLKKYKGADDISLTVHRTAETLPGYSAERDEGYVIEGRFIPESNELHLNASAFGHGNGKGSFRSQVEATIREEILVHKGLGFFEPETRQELYAAIQQAALESKELAELWGRTVRDYEVVADSAGLNEEERNRLYAEELLGTIAQEKPSLVKRGYNKIYLAIKNLLIRAGWVKPTTGMAELRATIYDMGDAFRKGHRSRLRSFSRDVKGELYSREEAESIGLAKKLLAEMEEYENSKVDDANDVGAFSRKMKLEPNPEREKALGKLGLNKQEASRLSQAIESIKNVNIGDVADRAYEGVFDGLVGIKRAEDEAGKGIAAGDYESSGYVGARLASGVSDTMTAVMYYGQPHWSNGVVEHKPGTRGLLDMFGELGESLTDWLGWVAGHRGEELMNQGRENNLDEEDIAYLKGLADTKEKRQLFQRIHKEYAEFNKSMLDLAEEAGLVKAEARKEWESEWYIPFYRDSEEDMLMGPRTQRGLSHQTSGIKQLRGGDMATGDLLENVLTNFLKLTDSSMKNMALLKTVDNLKESRFIEREPMAWAAAMVPKAEIYDAMLKDAKYAPARDAIKKAKGDVELAILTMQEQEEASTVDLLSEAVEEYINSQSPQGLEKMWSMVAPSDPEVIRVKRDGKNEFYRVHDESLLRGLTHISNTGNNGFMMRSGRWFKRLLTTGVTASPDFIIRNLVRDSVHSWAINKDGFFFGKDTVKGIKDALAQNDEYREMMFAGASFQGGYVHGTDPEAGAQMIRRALQRKGLSKKQINAHMDSILDTPAKMKSALQEGWQVYRNFGDKMENSNRLATFQAARNQGKSLAQALYESKDLMDYSLRGNWAAMNTLTDLIPFLNARLQGLSKLARAAEFKGDLKDPRTWRMSADVGKAMTKIALVSVLLAMANDDDERYKELQDWQKDAYWHIFLGDQHWQIPKPFEIGILAGTIPERMYRTWVSGTQTNEELLWSLQHGTLETLSLNPIPQAVLPLVELWGNKSWYFETPIEGMGDSNKLPKDRYNTHTSDLMVELGQLTGLSPKQMEHLWKGYTGTMGAYGLSIADLAVRKAMSKPAKGEIQIERLPVIKSFYKGGKDSVNFSTQYATDFYNRMEEVRQLYGSFKELEGGERKAFLKENRDKLRFRKGINRTSRKISKLRKRMNEVRNSTTLSAKEKDTRSRMIQSRINQLQKRMVEASDSAF